MKKRLFPKLNDVICTPPCNTWPKPPIQAAVSKIQLSDQIPSHNPNLQGGGGLSTPPTQQSWC